MVVGFSSIPADLCRNRIDAQTYTRRPGARTFAAADTLLDFSMFIFGMDVREAPKIFAECALGIEAVNSS